MASYAEASAADVGDTGFYYLLGQFSNSALIFSYLIASPRSHFIEDSFVNAYNNPLLFFTFFGCFPLFTFVCYIQSNYLCIGLGCLPVGIEATYLLRYGALCF